PEDAVLVEGQSLAQRQAAQPDVVRLRAGEVLPGRAELLGGHRPAVDLHAAAGDDRALGVAADQHPLHLGEGGEGGEHLDGSSGGGEQVEVTDAGTAAPVGPGDLDALDGGDAAQ